MKLKAVRDGSLWFIIPLIVSVLMALLDSGGWTLPTFLAYLVVSLICALLFWFSWRTLAGLDRPRWLLLAALLAIGLRLGLGVILTYGLPQYGYSDSRPHQAGYIYKDAYQRDIDAWQLAKSEKFDLVVIGSRGLSGVKELILGSVSGKVVNNSTVPVLVVK